MLDHEREIAELILGESDDVSWAHVVEFKQLIRTQLRLMIIQIMLLNIQLTTPTLTNTEITLIDVIGERIHARQVFTIHEKFVNWNSAFVGAQIRHLYYVSIYNVVLLLVGRKIQMQIKSNYKIDNTLTTDRMTTFLDQYTRLRKCYSYVGGVSSLITVYLKYHDYTAEKIFLMTREDIDNMRKEINAAADAHVRDYTGKSAAEVAAEWMGNVRNPTISEWYGYGHLVSITGEPVGYCIKPERYRDALPTPLQIIALEAVEKTVYISPYPETVRRDY